MKKIKLTGKTLHGKNRIREACTDVWIILRSESSVRCCNDKPGLLVKPDSPSTDLRWVAIENDRDFKVEILQ